VARAPSVSLLTHQHTEDERLPAGPRGGAAPTASFLLWGPTAERPKAALGRRVPGSPQAGPGLGGGEPSTPWLPPALGRGHWQLDPTQGAPLLTPPLWPEHQLTEHCVPSRGQGSLVCVAGWRPRGPSFGNSPPPMPSSLLQAAAWFQGSCPQPQTHTLAAEFPHLGPGRALAFRVPPAQCPRPLHFCGSHDGPGR